MFKEKIRRRKEKEGRSGFRVGVSSESTAEQLEMQKKFSSKHKMSFERT